MSASVLGSDPGAELLRRWAQLAAVLLYASGCFKREASPEIGPEPTKWLDGARALEFREAVPLGHYLGPGHVHGTGKIAEGGAATFDDGVLWITRDQQTQRVEAGAPFEGVAVELTIAQVNDWYAVTLSSRCTLRGAVERARSEAVLRGFTASARLPLRIEGVPTSRRLRVGRARREIAADAVVVIGFLDGPVHAVVASVPISGELGELGDVELEAGARVLIPNAAPTTSRRDLPVEQ